MKLIKAWWCSMTHVPYHAIKVHRFLGEIGYKCLRCGREWEE